MDTLNLSTRRSCDLDNFNVLVQFLGASPKSHDTYVQILVSKLDGQDDLRQGLKIDTSSSRDYTPESLQSFINFSEVQ